MLKRWREAVSIGKSEGEWAAVEDDEAVVMCDRLGRLWMAGSVFGCWCIDDEGLRMWS